MNAAETGKKVIFERFNGLFGSIHAMDVRQDELKSNVVVAQVFLTVSGHSLSIMCMLGFKPRSLR